MASDVDLVLGAYPRIGTACRARGSGTGPRAPSEHQGRILAHLDRDDPVMVTELAEYTGVTASTMSLTLKRLETAGWITRDRDPQDRRVTNVRLTESGMRARDRASRLDPRRVDAMLLSLRPEERRWAVRGLALLAEAADAMLARDEVVLGALTGDGRS